MSGLLKLLFPNGTQTPAETEELLQLAMECRKRVKDQLARIDSTYPDVDFHYVDAEGRKRPVTTVEEEEFPQFYKRRPAREREAMLSPEAAPAPVVPTAAVQAAVVPPSSPARAVAKEGHSVFTENRKGINFERLFAPYLAGASQIIVTDPYIRLFYQARNMMELLELIIHLTNPEDQVSVHLLTTSDEGSIGKQRDYLDSMVAACAGTSVTFTWAFDDTGAAHARHIVTNTGWKISLDRGLDIFQQYPMNEAFNLANRLQEHRAVKQFEVTYLRPDRGAPSE